MWKKHIFCCTLDLKVICLHGYCVLWASIGVCIRGERKESQYGDIAQVTYDIDNGEEIAILLKRSISRLHAVFCADQS